MNRIHHLIALAFLSLALAGSAQAPFSQDASPKLPARVIEMTAKKYEFNPSEIRVPKGATVELRILALDRTHGIEFALYPEGSKKEGPTGLRFAGGEKKWRLEKNQERVIQFVADRPGTYVFKCAVRCGLGHGRMKGILIVEE